MLLVDIATDNNNDQQEDTDYNRQEGLPDVIPPALSNEPRPDDVLSRNLEPMGKKSIISNAETPHV